MFSKEELINDLMNRLRNLPHAPVIATPGAFNENWKIIPEGSKIQFRTLVDNAELIFTTKGWQSRLLLPKNSVFETHLDNNGKMIIDFINMKPNDIVIDELNSDI